MNKHGKKIVLVEKDPKTCPEHIMERYNLWYNSFIAWTILYYAITLANSVFSVVMIYYAADGAIENTAANNKIIVVLSLLSAITTTCTYLLSPREHADGFYKASIKIEYGILKFQFGLIDKVELIEILEDAEKKTMH